MIHFDDLTETNETQRLPISTPAGECVLLYRRPSVEDLDLDQWRSAVLHAETDRGSGLAALARSRREAVIVGWEGIETEVRNQESGVGSQAVPFSQQRLLLLMLRVPAVESAVTALLDRLYTLEPLAGEPLRLPASGTPAAGSTTSGASDSPGSSSSPGERDFASFSG